MKTYTFTYEHNHGDRFWDYWVIPIVERLEIEAENEEEAIELGEIEVMKQLNALAKKLGESKDDNTLMTILGNRMNSPFNTNSLNAEES
jgi:hypothetical protein